MPETILIVDDASNHLRMTGHTIGQKLGYHIVTAAGGEEAISWVLSARQPQPDLLLLDLSGDVDGLHIIRRIKASRPQLPVIALVPYGNDNCIEQAVHVGISDFLSKPVTVDRLRLSLRNALMIHRLRNTIARLEWRLGDGNEASGWLEMPRYQDNGALNQVAMLFDGQGRIKKLKSIEEEVIRLALQYNNGCMTRAARQLGIGRSTLYRRISEIERADYISRANHATRPMMSASSTERS